MLNGSDPQYSQEEQHDMVRKQMKICHRFLLLINVQKSEEVKLFNGITTLPL